MNDDKSHKVTVYTLGGISIHTRARYPGSGSGGDEACIDGDWSHDVRGDTVPNAIGNCIVAYATRNRTTP